MNNMAKVLFAIFLLSFAVLTRAQTVFPPGGFSIDGVPVSCGAAVTVIQPGLPDGAMARFATPSSPPLILINPMLLSMPFPVKIFVYGHECAHLMIGPDENMADCWSVKLGKAQGWFNESSIQLLTGVFGWSPGDWTHAPGPVRLSNIRACYYS